MAQAATARKERENGEFAEMMGRMLRSWGRRLEDADDYDLAEFVEFVRGTDEVLVLVVGAWRRSGRSWSDVGRALGSTRQAAQQRFAGRI